MMAKNAAGFLKTGTYHAQQPRRRVDRLDQLLMVLRQLPLPAVVALLQACLEELVHLVAMRRLLVLLQQLPKDGLVSELLLRLLDRRELLVALPLLLLFMLVLAFLSEHLLDSILKRELFFAVYVSVSLVLLSVSFFMRSCSSMW